MSGAPFRAIAWHCHAKTTVVHGDDGPTMRLIADCSNTGAREYQAEHEEAAARRIAAALNSCRGLSTEQLEQIPDLLEAALPYHRLQAQRDALLDALQLFMATDASFSTASDDMLEKLAADGDRLAPILIKSRAAIALLGRP